MILTFSEFAQILMPILGSGANTAEFTKELFSNITTFPDDMDGDYNPIHDVTSSAILMALGLFHLWPKKLINT